MVRTDRLPGQPDANQAGLVRGLRRPAGHADLFVPAGRRKTPGQGQAAGAVGAEGPPASGQARPDRARDAAGGSLLPGLSPFIREETVLQARRSILAGQAAVTASEQVLTEALDAAAAEKAQYGVALAKKGLKAARADLAAVEAAIAADTARYAQPPRPDAATLARIAARLDRKRALKKAEEGVLRAETAHHEAKLAALTQTGKADAKQD